MGTKPAPLNVGDRMWLRASGGQHGQACWVAEDKTPYQPAICVHLDDGSGRTRDEQLAGPRGTRRWVTRGQLVAFGTATWFRESHQAFQANQAALELAQLQASRLAASRPARRRM